MNQNSSSLVVFALGCSLSGRGTALRTVQQRCLGVSEKDSVFLDTSLILKSVPKPEDPTDDEHPGLICSSIAIPFVKSELMVHTLGKKKKRLLLCNGACQSPYEVPEYFNMILKRREGYEILVWLLECPLAVALERAAKRVALYQTGGNSPKKKDLGKTPWIKWHRYAKNLPHVMEAIHRFDGVRVVSVNADQPEEVLADSLFGLVSPHLAA